MPHCPKTSLNLRIKSEHVTDATYGILYGYVRTVCLAQKPHIDQNISPVYCV